MNRLLPPLRTAPWRRLRRPLRAQAALAWLLLALVVVPTLGRLHQVVHAQALEQLHAGPAWQSTQAPAPHGFPAAPVAEGAAPQARADHARGLLWPLLLADHAPADCLLLDQLALGDALHSAPQALPEAGPPPAPPLPAAGRTRAVHVTLFQARGPPAA